MKRPWLWIVGGRWDRVAALTRFFTVLAILFLYTGYNHAAERADRDANRLALLHHQIGTDSARISQLEDALRSGRIPIPPPPTSTTSTTTRLRRTTRRTSETTTTSTTTRQTTTTSTTPCPAPTVPRNGACLTIP